MAHYHAACRRWGHSQALMAELCNKPPSPRLTALLAIGLAGLFQGRWAAPIWVHQCVEAARRLGGESPARFANAVLKKALARIQASPAADQPGKLPSAMAAFPVWLQQALPHATEADWQALAQTLEDESRMVLRWMGGAEQRAACLAAWRARGLQIYEATSQEVGDPNSGALWVHPPTDPQKLEGYEDGLFRVQNPSAQMAKACLCLKPGMRVLDACAAPGGKTFLWAESPNIDIIALDTAGPRLERMARELERLRPRLASIPTLVCGDARNVTDFGSFDAVVLDAPCTGLGTLGRHPEVVWRRSAQDLSSVLQLQASLLRACWRHLRPGGQLLYMTCSVLPAEGEEQILSFLSDLGSGKAELLPAPGQLWPRPSGVGENATAPLPFDGFYFASLRKLA